MLHLETSVTNPGAAQVSLIWRIIVVAERSPTTICSIVWPNDTKYVLYEYMLDINRYVALCSSHSVVLASALAMVPAIFAIYYTTIFLLIVLKMYWKEVCCI